MEHLVRQRKEIILMVGHELLRTFSWRCNWHIFEKTPQIFLSLFLPDVWKYFSHQFFAEKNVEWLAWISQVPFFISKEQLQLLKWDFLSCRSQTSALGQQSFHSSNSTKEVPTCVETFWVWYKFRHRTFSLGVWSMAVTSWSQPQIADHDLL